MIPLLLNHDHTKPIGTVEFVGNKLVVKTTVPLSKRAMQDTFGNTGGRVLKMDGLGMVLEFELLEFSLDARYTPDRPL